MVAFPEGTTWCGLASGRFYPAMFQAAVDTGRPVQPLRLRYHHRDGRVSTVPAYVGDDTLARSIGRLLVARRTVARVYVESLQLPAADRRELAQRCQAAVRMNGGARPRSSTARARAGLLSRLELPRYPGRVMVYLDHAATTPMYRAAIEAMTAALSTVGNASSLHTTGRGARRRMEESRELIAAKLGARPSEVIFTAGGTESDNLAVKGIYWARRDAEPRHRRIVTTAVEHHAVLDAVNWLVEHEGAEVTWLPTAADGSVSGAALRDALQRHDDVALVSVMWANNEVGTIMPIDELAAIAAEFDVPMHSDAVQAVGQLPVVFAASQLSAMSVAAHKFGGPPGVGALLLRRDVGCVSLSHGGGQERDIRSGTPDVAGAVGMATAMQLAVDGLEANSARLRLLRDQADRRRAGHASMTLASTVLQAPDGSRVTRTSPSTGAKAMHC